MSIAEIPSHSPPAERDGSMASPGRIRNSNNIALPACCLALLLIVAIPLFLRMPLTNDTELFDLQARIVREGGVLYRDALEPNLPGVVWTHLLVRLVAGESAEAMRAFDLLVLASIVLMSAQWVRDMGQSPRRAWWTATATTLCYLSLSEWCHCQRDTWMLLPSLAGLLLRWRAIRRLQQCAEHLGSNINQGMYVRSCGPTTLIFLGFLEGLVWGCGIWIKPYVVIVAILAWIISLVIGRDLRRSACDTVGLLVGGLTVGAAGIAWMIHSGCWTYFVDTVRHWNPGYFAAGKAHWTFFRFIGTAARLFPWFFLHLLAIPIAIRSIVVAASRTKDISSERTGVLLLSAAYLGWLGQSFFLQHLFDYVHVPALLLAILVLSTAWNGESECHPRRTMVFVGFSILALVSSPLLRTPRIENWLTCLTGPGSARLQDSLAQLENPNHQDLERVAEFLRRQRVGQRDVCCYNSDLVSLYRLLGTRSPTRFTYLFEICIFLHEKLPEIEQDVAASGQRYVVTDLISCGMPASLAREVGPLGPTAPPPKFKPSQAGQYPFSHPIIYRSGSYLVHKIDGLPGHLHVPRMGSGTKTSENAVAKQGSPR